MSKIFKRWKHLQTANVEEKGNKKWKDMQI